MLSDDEFVAVWTACKGSPVAVAKAAGMAERSIYKRRKRLQDKGIILSTVASTTNAIRENEWQQQGWSYKRENQWQVSDGNIVVFSDAHWWPDQKKTVAHVAMLNLIKELKPRGIVANGDIFDGARVSRHAPLGWAKSPSVKEEIDICQDNMHEIVLAAPKGCELFWTIGNHDQRFDKAMVSNASEYAGLTPRLESLFDRWNFAWSLRVNENVMIKHRYANGIHATYNNAMKSGQTMVTGHLHRLAVMPWADYNGIRWGVDTGTLSDPHGPQFEYGENNPTPHTSGFAVLTFKDGMLLPPELCTVINGHAYFRGKEVV